MAWELRNLFDPYQLPQQMAVCFTAEGPVRIDELHLRCDSAGVVPATVMLRRAGAADVTSTHNMHPGQTWDCDNLIGLVLAEGDTLSAAATASRVTLTGRGTFMS